MGMTLTETIMPEPRAGTLRHHTRSLSPTLDRKAGRTRPRSKVESDRWGAVEKSSSGDIAFSGKAAFARTPDLPRRKHPPLVRGQEKAKPPLPGGGASPFYTPLTGAVEKAPRCGKTTVLEALEVCGGKAVS